MKKNESFPNHSADHKKRQEKTPSVERVLKSQFLTSGAGEA